VAKTGNTMLLPTSSNDPAAATAAAMNIFNQASVPPASIVVAPCSA
jgi:acyl-CoA reductase-like NAD-dependent aldehyde dehydrogenase